jgi:predicted aspartyl protease
MPHMIQVAALAMLALSAESGLPAQTPSAGDEIPIERCDRLPVVKVAVGKRKLRFLVDTGATTVLNLKSFSGGHVQEIAVTSWSGTAATSAREVSVSELTLGKHKLENLKLPAIDLSPIGSACGGPIDGILGVDLLDRMGVTIDLKRQVASLAGDPPDAKAVYGEMEAGMAACADHFQNGNALELQKCLDPEIVLYTPDGEFHGRHQVVEYLRRRYFRFAPKLCYTMTMHEAQVYGNALWYSYDYAIDTPREHTVGHGMAMCRKSEGRWLILNMHNSLRESAEQAAPKPLEAKEQ